MGAGSLGRAETGPEDKTIFPSETAGCIFPPHLRRFQRLRMPIPLRAGLAPEPSEPLEIMKRTSETLIPDKWHPACLQHRQGDAASCQMAIFIVFCKYEFSNCSYNFFLLTPGKRGPGGPPQSEPAIRGWVGSKPRWRSAASFSLPPGNGLLGDVQGSVEDRTDALYDRTRTVRPRPS